MSRPRNLTVMSEGREIFSVSPKEWRAYLRSIAETGTGTLKGKSFGVLSGTTKLTSPEAKALLSAMEPETDDVTVLD